MWTGCSDPTDMATRGSSKTKRKRERELQIPLDLLGCGWRRAEERSPGRDAVIF